MLLVHLIDTIGKFAIKFCTLSYVFLHFLWDIVRTAITTPLKGSKLITQMNRIGVESCPIIMLTGLFSGMVFALQSYIGFQRIGGQHLIGAVVAQALFREMGPVLTGLMVTARAASAITAEIGTMRITEQIDALITLRINIMQYLMVPRIIAGIIMVPCLALFCMLFGILGGYIVCVYVLSLSADDYWNGLRTFVALFDIVSGLIKSLIFGLILTWVATYKGLHTTDGARGVGLSTMQSVVISSVMILVANYFITKLLE